MHPAIRGVLGAATSTCMLASGALAQNNNYPDRRALILNTCPSIELSDFSYVNQYDLNARSTRFHQNLTWKNIGTQPVIAFEVVILKYDAFNQRLIGTRWTVTGKNSADWRPLAPGSTDQDGTIGYGDEEVYTAIAYVRTARFADGTVWHADEADILARLRSLKTGIPDFGSTRPDSMPRRSPSE
jgi:hypothetical protein